MAQAGVPGVDVTSGMQFFGPAKMPPEVLGKIYADGASEIVASSAAEHAASVQEQYERWGGVIRKLGLKLD